MLQTLDHLWREHIVMLEHLRQVIGLRGYGQPDRFNEYRSQALKLFEAMVANLREAVTSQLMRVEIVQPARELASKVEGAVRSAVSDKSTVRQSKSPLVAATPAVPIPTGDTSANIPFDPKNPASWGKLSRNELCPCGSGKRYKHCHGHS